MLEINSVLIIFVTIILTAIVIGIGWQIILILVEIRKMLEKTNSFLVDIKTITTNVSSSITNINSFSKVVMAIANFIKPVHRNNNELDTK